ncbi:MAG: ATP-binding protein [bacterium]|nr:ATP-binding protein [bacterium]
MSFLRTLTKRLLPPDRRESRIIAVGGIAIMLFVAALADLMLTEIGDSARVSTREQVEQLARAVTHQLATTLFMVERSMTQASADIREANDPSRIAELGSDGQVATNLLNGFFFINPQGRVVASVTATAAASDLIDLSDRAYFRVHLDSKSLGSRIGQPVVSRLTKVEVIPVSHPVRRRDGELMGVIVAMIDIAALERIWKDIGLQSDDRLELLGEDATVWFRWPDRSAGDIALGDGISWSRRVAGWPLQVVVASDQGAIDSQTLPARRAIIVAATAGIVMIGLFTFLLANRAQLIARERAAGDAVRARLLAATNAIPVEFIEYDSERRLIMANQAARDASPWRTPGAARGLTIDEVMASYGEGVVTGKVAEAWKAWAAETVAAFDRGGISELRRPDGEWRRSYVSDMPAGGRVVVRVDITEAKKHEAQLAVEMERLSSVFQSTGAAILLLDHNARVLLANQFVLDLQATTTADIVGLPYAELVLSGLDLKVIAGWQAHACPQRLKPVEFECNVAVADGQSRIFRVTANPMQDDAGHLHYIVLIGVDDTEHRMVQARLFNSARLASLGEMATGMAHEINQPLTVIRLATDTLDEELESPEAAALPAALGTVIRAALYRISSQTERAASLVRNLRTVARAPTHASAPFDIVEAARRAGDLLQEQLKAARIAFSLDLPSPGLMVVGETNQLQQVLINLVLNARDALLDQAGRPTSGTLGHIKLRISGVPESDGIVLTVEDDGPGIPADVLPRLFEPFFTTKPTGKGTGLGLSISYDIIRHMGGVITAGNCPEGGARFRIVFPPLSPDTQDHGKRSD